MAQGRKIIHVDMDAFYASVEQRDNPALRGKPVVVGGPPDSRGVVCTASYEARRFGVRSAMPSSRAARLCPQAIFVQPRFEAYKEASRTIQAIFHEVTDQVEPLSLDEAYLDVTQNRLGLRSATWVAEEIRRRIFAQTGLTASAGVSINKFLAKLASDMDKPNGLTVISPDRIEAVLTDLPVRRIFGIGAATEARMAALGLLTVTDLRRAGEATLTQHFGRSGGWYHNLAYGRDNRPVCAERSRKSLGAEETFARDLTSAHDMHAQLRLIAERVMLRQARADFEGRTVTVKVTYAGFEKVSRSRTLPAQPDTAAALLQEAWQLLRATEAGKRPVRLLGICLSNPDSAAPAEVQLRLPLPTPLALPAAPQAA